MHPTELAFHSTIENYLPLLMEKNCVIVGYSGGADSSCLLRLMHSFCLRHKIHLAAAHVNHGIRGEDADLDEKFCRETCAELGIEFYSHKADVPALAASAKTGIEETARRVRYDFFDEISEKLTGSASGSIIATAHNADDNLETVLFHLLRGSGLHGLCGIDPLRGGRYLRPLLTAKSDDIREWCAENDIPYRTDSTNSDTTYTRNHIRHNIAPQLKTICDDPAAAVSRMTALLRQDDDYLESQARLIIGEDTSSIPREKLASLHPAIASRVIRLMYDNAKDSTATIEEVHVRKILRLLEASQTDASLSLPGKMRFRQDRREAAIEADSMRRGAGSVKADVGIPFSYPSDGDFFENELYSVHFSQSRHNCHSTDDNIDENIYKLSILTTLRFDKIMGVLRIRYKTDGDVCYYGGHTHRLKRMFSDKKLTSREKELYPILYDDSGIIWVPGYPPRDGMMYRGEGTPLFVRFTTV